MAPTDAVVLENWFPRANSVDVRPGAANHVTGFSETPQSLLVWNGPTSEKLFCSTASNVYDVTSAGALGSAVVTHQLRCYTNFTTAGGHYLIACDPTGTGTPKSYNGSTWANLTFTGITLTTIRNVAVAKRRLWFCVAGSLTAYYGAVASISGALTGFDLGQVFGRGGTLVAVGSWTLDGGDGQDDYVVFVSSQGELAIYKGTDPSTSATFSLVGVFYLGEPLGYQCLTKFGGDLLYLCQNGLFPLSKALLSATINYRSAFTSKIETAFAQAIEQFSDSTVGSALNSRWSVCVYPTGSFLLINIPTAEDFSIQYVMNTITGAWCVFSGWSSTCFEVFRGQLFFTSAAAVAEGWIGTSDFGANIVATAQQAYNALGAPNANKHVELLRPIVEVNETTEIRYSLSSDYSPAVTYSTTTLNVPSSGIWGSGVFGTALWGGASGKVVKDWITAFARDGFVFSFGHYLATNKSTVRWISTDFAYKPGGVL
jgi:hypothetical protein